MPPCSSPSNALGVSMKLVLDRLAVEVARQVCKPGFEDRASLYLTLFGAGSLLSIMNSGESKWKHPFDPDRVSAFIMKGLT